MCKRFKTSLLIVTFIAAFSPIIVKANSIDTPDFIIGSYKNLHILNILDYRFLMRPYQTWQINIEGLRQEFNDHVDIMREFIPDKIIRNGHEYDIVQNGTEIIWRRDGQVMGTQNTAGTGFEIEAIGFFTHDNPPGSGNMQLSILQAGYSELMLAFGSIQLGWSIYMIDTIAESDVIVLPSDLTNGQENGILSDIIDYIIHVFIPREDFWEYHFNRLDGRLRDKLPFQTYIDTIGRLKEVSNRLDGDYSMLDLTYELDGQEFQLDIARHISPFLQPIRLLVTGLYAILLAYYNYRQIMFMVRGRNYQSGRCDH